MTFRPFRVTKGFEPEFIVLASMFGLASNSTAASLAEFDRLMKVKKVKTMGAKSIGYPEVFEGKTRNDSRPTSLSLATKATTCSVAVRGEIKNKSHSLDCSSSGVTCSSSGSTLWVENKLDKIKSVALRDVQEATDIESAGLTKIRKSLCNAAEVAVARFEVKNERGAILSMKKFKALCAEYEKAAMNISSLQELYDEIALGDGDDPTDRRVEVVQAHIKFVEGHRWHINNILTRTSVVSIFSEEALLHELASGKVQTYVATLHTALSF
jgi:hypothetical protein